jgi:hypothetical protein
MYVNLNNIGCVVDSTLASHAGARTNIYHTRCEGANYYITDAAKINSDSK